jgi:hypothetical protein
MLPLRCASSKNSPRFVDFARPRGDGELVNQYLVGGPSFAFFAEDGYHDRNAAGFVQNGQQLPRRHRRPPLQRTKDWHPPRRNGLRKDRRH